MALSLSFSVFLYQISNGEISRNFRRPIFVSVQDLNSGELDKLTYGRLREAQDRMQFGLLLFNLVVLIAGGAGSYFLARRTLKPIEEAFAAQSRFTADASHELRTPLTAMQSEIEVALRNKNLSSKASRQLLESNLEEVRKLESLSEALLKLAQNGHQKPEFQPVALQDVVDEALTNLKTRAKAKKINIKADSSPLVVTGDKEMLTEALTIVLDNAIKYSPAKSEVRIQATEDNHSAKLNVRDRGDGIAPRDLPYIFDRFYRGDRSRSKKGSEGYGLGLSIAQHIMQVHGGKISVSSRNNLGSTFTLTIPKAST